MNKAEVLMHPVRIKITQALMRSSNQGLSTLEMLKLIKDVPQATLYRHIQVMLDAGIISIVKEEKVRSVTEKYYALNGEAARLNAADMQHATKEQKLSFVSYYQLTLMTQYQSYLEKISEENADDLATFSMAELKLDDTEFQEFLQELHTLVMKYHEKNRDGENVPGRTIGFTVIPEV